MNAQHRAQHEAWLLWYEEQIAQEQQHPEDCIEMQPCECPVRQL